MRVVLQRHRGDVGGDRRRCATARRPTEDLARLERWSVVLRGRGACATLDAATNVAASLLSAVPASRDTPSRRRLRACRDGAFSARATLRGGGGGDELMKIRLDRTMCDGFGICAKHAPEYFSLDDWGYASLIGDGTVPEEDHDAVMRALLDCPVHAIIAMGEHDPRGRARRTVPIGSRPSPTRRPMTTKRSRDSSGDQTAARTHRAERVLLDLGRRRACCASRNARAAAR